MDLQEFGKKFKLLPSKEKVKFIYKHINDLEEGDKISFLLSIIKDKKSSALVRATAIEVLSQSAYQESAIFQEYAKNSSQIVAKSARKALKELELKEKKNKQLSQSVLRKIRSSEEKQKRLEIIKSIVGVKTTWVIEVLLEALEDPSEEVRDFIINELGKRKYINLDLIYRKLFNPRWYVKSSILKILGIRKSPLSLSLIKAVLNDSNADVRRSAAYALGEIGGKEALVLLNKLAKDKNRFVRKSAEEGLNKVSNLKFS